MVINVLAEGYMEEAVASRLIRFCNHELGTVYGRRGCIYIQEKASAFQCLATEQTAVLVLTDFRDAKASCVPEALPKYIFTKCPTPHKNFLCRFSVNELESWFLADREGLAKYLNIAVAKLPHTPENEEYPKATLVNLARKSRKKIIREGVAPPLGHKASVGPEYFNLMREFIFSHWNIENAIKIAPSLERCVCRLREIT